MDWSWFNALTPPLSEILVATAAEYAALAGPALYTAARTRIEARRAERRQQETIQAAIQRALQDALLQGLPALGDVGDAEEEVMTGHLAMLGEWMARPGVVEEYARLIAPTPHARPDRDRLHAEFRAAGYDPDRLAQPFSTVIEVIGTAFASSAAWEGELQGVMGLRLARRRAELLERLAPLDLDELERHYLNQVYGECNALPLADVEKGHSQPRLQRVFVPVRVRDAAPTLSQVMERLGFADFDQADMERLIRDGLGEADRGSRQAALLSEMGGSTGDRDGGMIQAMRQMNDEGLSQIAEKLALEVAELRRSLENLTPLELLAAQEAPRLALLGDPGSGKSTLTRRWAGILASLGQPDLRADWVEDEELAADELLRLFGRWLMPVRVVLSQWAQGLPDFVPNSTQNTSASDLLDECWRIYNRAAKLDGDGAKQRFLAKFVGDAPAALLLLDGLDEVTDPLRRQSALHGIEDFVRTYPRVPIIVTSRVRPYDALRRQNQALDLPLATLDRLTGDEIAHFVNRWHEELVETHAWEETQAGDRRRHFMTALADPHRAELREMAGTPLLLTMMVKVNYKERLPDSRAGLYEAFVKQLLLEWERYKYGEGSEKTPLDRLLDEAGIPEDQFAYYLNRLAYAIHDGANRDSVDIPEDAFRRMLMALYIGDPDDEDPESHLDDDALVTSAYGWARRVMRLIAERSGLINWEAKGIYKFSHRSLQEYLAARWMATGRDFLDKFTERFDDEDWRETVLLAIGYQCKVRGAPYDDTIDVLHEFWPEQLGTEAATYRALLVGEAFVYQLGPQRLGRRKLARDLHAQVVEGLTAIMQQPDLTAYLGNAKAQARTRLTAGLLLADLGILPPDLDAFVSIPTKESLGYDFQMGKYPVTNAQFRRFFDDGGYDEDKPWWTEKVVKDLERFYSKEWRNGPRYWDDGRFNRATQPVVGVSWYEAVAYCEWLTERLRANKTIRPDEKVRLPTEEEWLRVALGAPLSQTGRGAGGEGERYPWGPTFDPAFANTEESDLDQTTPVHMYPDGQSAEEVWDLSGNVWEWSKDDHSFGKALRGGSWYNKAQASARLGRYPLHWLFNFGFRCVVVPSLS